MHSQTDIHILYFSDSVNVISPSLHSTFKVGAEDFLVDGFLDWSTAEDDHASELNWTTQYKWNAGKHISPNTRLYVGIEHSVWNNKYGNKSGINQNDVSALVKYHF